MLVLCHIRALDIAKWWVCSDQAYIAQILQPGQVFLLFPSSAIRGQRSTIISFQPTTTKCKGTKCFVNVSEKLLGTRHSQRNMWGIKVFHVMRALQVFNHISAPSSAKRFNSKHLTLLHASSLTSFHTGNRFSCMNLIGTNGVSIKVSAALNRVHFTVNFHLVTFHNFLNCLTHFTQLHINARRCDTSIGGVFHSLQQRIKLGIECYSPRAVHNSSINLGAKVDLHDVVFTQCHLVSWIRSVMRCNVVNRAASRKANSSLQTIFHY
mmetsp:Transcript_139/g.258  ORF Transcript_139/g.258 Transcript_139/m.258 type:complete len:266 (+) Transcript_139:260-1057(+)